MDSKVEYDKSVVLWVAEQEVLISTLKLNIEYIDKEIELKKRALQLYKDSLIHEELFLSNYFK